MTYSYPPQYAYPSAPPMFRALPAPPRLHWGIVLALTIVTFGLFTIIWMLVQAVWIKNATKNARPFWWSLAYLLVIPVTMVLAFVGVLVATVTNGPQAASSATAMITVVMQITSFVVYVLAAFSVKNALEAEPIDIPLGGIMTFFFSAIYFQYHLFDYNVEGRVAEQLTGFAEPQPVAIAPMETQAPPQG